MKQQPSKSFKLSQTTVAVMTAIAAMGSYNLANANGGGFGVAADNSPVQTFYANTYVAQGANGVNDGSGLGVRGLRKFVDGLPGLMMPGGTTGVLSAAGGSANDLGQYLPMAIADTTSYPGSAYYEIAVMEYTEKMHSDLAKPTTLRGYVQIDRTLSNTSVYDPVAVANYQAYLAKLAIWTPANNAYQTYLTAKAAWDAASLAYQTYLTDKATWDAANTTYLNFQTALTAYNNYLTADGNWQTANTAYQTYLTNKAAWDTANATWQTYQTKLAAYNAFLAADATWQTANTAYQTYLTNKAAWDTANATWQTYQTNLAAFTAYQAAQAAYTISFNAQSTSQATFDADWANHDAVCAAYPTYCGFIPAPSIPTVAGGAPYGVDASGRILTLSAPAVVADPGPAPTNPGTAPVVVANPGTEPTAVANPGAAPANPGTAPAVVANPGTEPTAVANPGTGPTPVGAPPVVVAAPGNQPTAVVNPGSAPAVVSAPTGSGTTSANSQGIPLFYPDGSPVMIAKEVGMVNGKWDHTLVSPTVMIPAYGYDKPHYLGPIIVATKGQATRMKYVDLLPAGTAVTNPDGSINRKGDLFLPVDETLIGSGYGPDAATIYRQNRTALHWHGGDTPWISDGTPHQWIVPADDEKILSADYKRGSSTVNVPDMPDPGLGAETLYWPNNMSNRLMFYHDHAVAITRLNVYAGMAGGYLITDPVEAALTTNGTTTSVPGTGTIDGVAHNVLGAGLPPLADEIPLVFQDRTFVPNDIAKQDALWDQKHWGTEGDLWFPHVYEINQNPSMVGNGTNPVGRWDYGPWFWPVFPAPLQLPTGAYGDVTTTPEAFMDTPIVNGTAYPTVTVDPKAYRLRILNATNDRFLNLNFFVANSTVTPDGRTGTEVTMVPFTSPNTNTAVTYACPDGVSAGQTVGATNSFGTVVAPGWTETSTSYPVSFPCAGGMDGTGWGQADNRPGGVPFPGVPNADGSFNTAVAGPHIIQIGSEGGLLPNPVDIPPTAVNYEYNKRSVTVLNVLEHGLFLGSAERADVVVDFSAYAGKTLILYNDSPAPLPAGDPRIDYYTDDGDQTGAGGAPNTIAGFGPNTRTMMQFKVASSASTPVAPFNLGAPADPVANTPASGLYAALPTAYAASQEKPFVGESAYNNAFGTNNADSYGTIFAGSSIQPNFVFTPTTTTKQVLQSISLTGQGVGYTVAPNVVLSGGGLTTSITIAPVAGSAGAQVAGGKVTSIILPSSVITQTSNKLITAPTVAIVSNLSGGIAVGQGANAMAFTDQTISAPLQMKAIQELFDPSYGRMNATLGVELPFTSPLNQTTIPLGYIDPTTENIPENQIQIWKITHNGVDSHPVHFHLFNLQVINRVGWDGTIKPPYDNEQGWKETLRMNPLEDVYVAVRPRTPLIPFGVKDSVRMMDPSQPAGAITGFTQVDPTTGVAPIDPVTGLTVQITNKKVSFGWEYVWHCHILGHEENDFMRPINFAYTSVIPAAPSGLTATGTVSSSAAFPVTLAWTDPTPAADPATMGNKQNEIGFYVQRAPIATTTWTTVGTTLANATSYLDTAPATAGGYSYQIVAFNQAGSSAGSAPASVGTVVSGGGAAPLAPSLVGATANSATQVTITWTDNSGATANNASAAAKVKETGFIVLRAVVTGTNVGAYSVVGTAPAHTGTGTGPSFVDTTAVAGTTYRYEVIATNNGANSAPAVSANVTMPAANVIPLGVTGLTATANSATQVTLSFTDNSGSTAGNATTAQKVMETGFLIERAVGTTGTLTYVTLSTAPLHVGTGTVTYVDTTASAATAYTYRVTTVNGTAKGTPATRTVTTPALPSLNAPSNVTIQMTGAQTATISFNDLAASETLYLVQVSTDSGKSWGDGTVTNFISTAPAFIASRSGAVTGTGSAVTINLPNARNAANLTMTQGASPYLFRVAAAIGSTSNAVYTDAAAGTTTNFTGVTSATTVGNWSNIAVIDLSGQTIIGAPTAVTAKAGVGSATLTWVDNANNNLSYLLQYSANGGSTWANVGTGATGVTTGAVIGGDATSATVSGLTAGTSYLFRLQAVSVGTNASSFAVSNAVVPTAPPAPATPAKPSVTNGNPNGTITAGVNWTAVQYATSYTVQWSTSSTFATGGTIKSGSVTGVTGTSYTLTSPAGVTSGANVYFRIVAVNATGSSAASTISNAAIAR